LIQRNRHGHFWQLWSDSQRTRDQDVREDDVDARATWRRFFSEYLGVAPEHHWLFGGRRFRPWFSGRWGPPNLFNPFVSVVMSKGGGLLSLYVLHLLTEKPRYGNDIMRQIQERTGGQWGSNPGAVYPLLSALEERGLVEGTWEDVRKRTRRIYSLTPAGHQELDRLRDVIRPKLQEAISVLRDLYDDLGID
jgi:DNA-binding PadR family transcriptional regulator